jgi:hypothetical protein
MNTAGGLFSNSFANTFGNNNNSSFISQQPLLPNPSQNQSIGFGGFNNNNNNNSNNSFNAFGQNSGGFGNNSLSGGSNLFQNNNQFGSFNTGGNTNSFNTGNTNSFSTGNTNFNTGGNTGYNSQLNNINLNNLSQKELPLIKFLTHGTLLGNAQSSHSVEKVQGKDMKYTLNAINRSTLYQHKSLFELRVEDYLWGRLSFFFLFFFFF